MLYQKSKLQFRLIRHYLCERAVIFIVCKELNIHESKIMNSSKSPKIAKQRILLAKYLMKYSNKNIMQLTKIFQRTQGTLSRQLNQLNENLEEFFPTVLLNKIVINLTRKLVRENSNFNKA